MENHEAYYSPKPQPSIGDLLRAQKFAPLKEWVEIDISLSADRKILGYKVIHSSNHDNFNLAVIDHIKQFNWSFTPKKIAGKNVTSHLTYRFDVFFDVKNTNQEHTIKGILKPLQSKTITTENLTSQDTLIFISYKAPENTFNVSKTNHNSGNFQALQVMKTVHTPDKFQHPYLKHVGFNTLNNKELLSFYEFYNAYAAYTNYPSFEYLDKNNNHYNPETINEHKPLADKTEYWTTRPHTAKPRFKESLHLFSNYYAELDSINFEGPIKLNTTVEASGLLNNTVITESSGIERLDEITLEVLQHHYLVPAYKNHQNIADEIDFEIEFKK